MTVGWIVCGFYTPDYRHWWDTLRASLELHGAAHDFVETEKLADGWEANTMAKPHQVQAAMDQHPDKVIIFLDVDCEVRGSLEPLVHLTGDVAFYMQTRRRKGDVKWGSIRSGTLVVRPTSRARAFVESWIAQVATFGDVDQNTLMLAVCATPGCTFEPLPVAYCAVASDKIEHPVILHDSASAGIDKIGTLAKRLARWGMPRRIVKAMPAKRTHV